MDKTPNRPPSISDDLHGGYTTKESVGHSRASGCVLIPWPTQFLSGVALNRRSRLWTQKRPLESRRNSIVSQLTSSVRLLSGVTQTGTDSRAENMIGVPTESLSTSTRRPRKSSSTRHDTERTYTGR